MKKNPANAKVLYRNAEKIQPQKMKFLFLIYVVALVLVFPKWAHLSPNSKRSVDNSSQYDAMKLTLSQAFSQICVKIGTHDHVRIIYACMHLIFHFFCLFSGISRSNLGTPG